MVAFAAAGFGMSEVRMYLQGAAQPTTATADVDKVYVIACIALARVCGPVLQTCSAVVMPAHNGTMAVH